MTQCWSEGLPQPDYPCTAVAVNLVEEDSASLAYILRGSNWVLREVRTCRQALEIARNEPFPVLLCERHMPDGDWIVLMDALREVADAPALIVVSRLADEQLWAEVLNLGAYDLLMTPFDRSELFRVLFLGWMSRTAEAERTRARLKKNPGTEAAESRDPKRLWMSGGR